MKVTYPLALIVAAAALLGSSVALRASDTDDSIESSFKTSVNHKIFLKDEPIEISSKDGAVTLSGSVANETHKSMAQDTAKALPGVKSVDNRIIVLPEVNAPTAEVSLKNASRRVPFYPSQAQKEQTTEHAKGVEGVKDVNEEMSVAKAPEKPAETVGMSNNDASITAQVQRSLSSDRLTRALDTKVSTINGNVLIGGKASSGAQRDLVTKLVTGVNGVKGVVNHMVIEETMSKND